MKLKTWSQSNFNKMLICLIVLVAIFKLGLIVSFKDTGWEPDSYMHFLQLDTVYKDFPNNAFTHGMTVWARPIFKFAYGIPVTLLPQSNLSTIQILNLAVFSISTFLLAQIILKLFKSKFLSIISAIFLMLGFLSFKSSISDLTEPLFTFLLVSGFYALTIKNNLYLAALFIGLSVLARFEGIFFIAIFCAWVLYYFRNSLKNYYLKILKIWIIAIVPVFVWNLIGFIQTGTVLYLFDKGYPTNSVDAYGTGSWIYYPVKFLTHEPIVTLLFIVGSALLLKNLFKKFKVQDKLFDQKILSLSFALLFIISQIITWKFGMFGSAGLMRYFVGIMPFMIIVGIEAILWIMVNRRWKMDISNAQISKASKKFMNTFYLLPNKYFPTPAFFITLLFIFQIFVLFVHFAGLFGFEKKWIRLEFPEHREAGLWIKENISKDELVASDRPEVPYYADRDLINAESWGMDFYRSGRKGIFVWSNSWTKGFGVSKTEPATKGLAGLEAFGNEIVLWRRQ